MSLRSWNTDDVQRVGYIDINGRRCLDATPPHHKPGFNTVIFDTKTGQVKDQRYFDTHRSTEESEKLSEYLRWLSDGMALLGLSAGEYRGSMTDDLKETLDAIGISQADDGRFCEKLVFAVVIGSPGNSIVRHSSGVDNNNLLVNVTIDSQNRDIRLLERL